MQRGGRARSGAGGRYPFNVPALGLWAVTLWGFSSAAFRDDSVPYAAGPPTAIPRLMPSARGRGDGLTVPLARAGQYDPAKAEAYFNKRWALKFGRAAQLTYVLGGKFRRIAERSSPSDSIHSKGLLLTERRYGVVFP